MTTFDCSTNMFRSLSLAESHGEDGLQQATAATANAPATFDPSQISTEFPAV